MTKLIVILQKYLDRFFIIFKKWYYKYVSGTKTNTQKRYTHFTYIYFGGNDPPSSVKERS